MNNTVNHTDYILSLLRNPYGLSKDELRDMRLKAADIIEDLSKQMYRLKIELSGKESLIKELKKILITTKIER